MHLYFIMRIPSFHKYLREYIYYKELADNLFFYLKTLYDFSPVSAVSIIRNLARHRKKTVRDCMKMIISAGIESIFVDMNTAKLLARCVMR